MVKSTKSQSHSQSQSQSQVDEEDEADGYDSTSYRGEIIRGDGISGGEQKANTHRSKHSETEQRRRSKINERFQILRELIPQNDQKRDKASFLLEVIEYIHFLQEKLQMYEEPCEAWNQEPSKLIPWKNHHTPDESLIDLSHIMKNGSTHEKNMMLTNAQNSMEADLGTASIYQAMNHPPVSTTQVLPFNVKTQTNAFSDIVRGGTPALSLHESLPDAENMACHPQSHPWQNRPCISECMALDNTLNKQEEPMSEAGLASTSSAYSQGILNTLTQALQSSGVDLSQTSISVQIDVGKRAHSGGTEWASSSKVQGSHHLSNEVMEQIGGGSCAEESHPGYKRLRTGKR